jgi:hypothetical protein
MRGTIEEKVEDLHIDEDVRPPPQVPTIGRPE